MANPGEASPEALERLRGALLFTPFSAESREVAHYFAWWAENLNFFHAFPLHEIPEISRKTGENITKDLLDSAIIEGYVSVVDFNGWGLQVAQLTPKYGSYTLPPSRREV